MKNTDILTDAIGGIDDKMIEKAYERRANKKSRAGVWEIVGIAASFVFIAGFAFLLSRFTEKNVNQAAYGGTDQLLYEKDFTDYNTHNIGFTSDDGALEYELKLILPSDERFFFKCYAKVINKSGNEIELHRLPGYNSFFYLENLLKSAEYEQRFVYKGNAKTDTVKLKPDGSYEELLTYTDGVKAYMKSDYVQHVHEVSGYLTVTVILDPSMSRTWGKSFYWFEGSYYKKTDVGFEEMLKSDGWYDGEKYQHYNIDNAESVLEITPEDIRAELPGVGIFNADDDIFVYTGGRIYRPINTFGGGLVKVFAWDYDNNGIKDLAAVHDWGSGLSYRSFSVFDLSTYKTEELHTEMTLEKKPFDVSFDGKDVYINGEKLVPNKTPPADFSFSLVWNTLGIRSYESTTGRLTKTSDTSNIKKYPTAYKMTASELAAVYNLLIQLKDYPENYDPYNDPSSETRVGSEPNRTVIVKFTADGIEKTITCSEICYGVNGGYNEAAKKFLQIEKQIEDMLTSTKQWQALPDYEFLYI